MSTNKRIAKEFIIFFCAHRVNSTCASLIWFNSTFRCSKYYNDFGYLFKFFKKNFIFMGGSIFGVELSLGGTFIWVKFSLGGSFVWVELFLGGTFAGVENSLGGKIVGWKFLWVEVSLGGSFWVELSG